MSAAVPQPASYGPGAIIGGKYRLESAIGEGGMATVWRATHLTLKRPVAVKFIHLRGPDPDALRERFLREARIAAAVRHRNVTDITDFGTTREGRPYMVMELLEGQSLADRMQDGPALSVPEAVRIVARTLSGLAAAHDTGVVHRDLKPENVFLQKDPDGAIHPKLFDFGISRSVGGNADLQSVMQTDDSIMVGTPHYMSPEQARGLKDIDHRTDLYSAGVILYELLAGQPPFDSENVGDLLILISTTDPVPLEQIRPDLGSALPAVVGRALSRDRDARFQSAREMRQALLQATAETAETMIHRGSTTLQGVGTDSDVPILQPGELLDAVGDSYEDGDSGVLEMGSLAPAARPSGSSSTVAEPRPHGAPRRSRRWPWVAAGAIVVLALGAGAAVLAGGGGGAGQAGGVEAAAGGAESPSEPAEPPAATGDEAESPREPAEPAPVAAPAAAEDPAASPQTVEVSLSGVPEGATVLVDGEEHEGTEIELARGEQEHRIEVRAPGYETWSVVHRATEGVRYAVQLDPEPRPRGSAARRRRRSTESGTGEDTVFRDPGF